MPSPKNRTCIASAVFGYISLTARGIFAQQCPASRATLVLRAATILPRADRAISLLRNRKHHARRSSYLEASSDAFFFGEAAERAELSHIRVKAERQAPAKRTCERRRSIPNTSQTRRSDSEYQISIRTE